MKKLLFVMLGVFLIIPMVSTAFAGGPPPKDVMKGAFVIVDEQAHTAYFKKVGSEDAVLLSLGEKIIPSDVRINKKVMVSLDKNAGENVVKSIDIMFMDMTVKRIISLLVIG